MDWLAYFKLFLGLLKGMLGYPRFASEDTPRKSQEGQFFLIPMTMILFVHLRGTYCLPRTETRDPMTLVCTVGIGFRFLGGIFNYYFFLPKSENRGPRCT